MATKIYLESINDLQNKFARALAKIYGIQIWQIIPRCDKFTEELFDNRKLPDITDEKIAQNTELCLSYTACQFIGIIEPFEYQGSAFFPISIEYKHTKNRISGIQMTSKLTGYNRFVPNPDKKSGIRNCYNLLHYIYSIEQYYKLSHVRTLEIHKILRLFKQEYLSYLLKEKVK